VLYDVFQQLLCLRPSFPIDYDAAELFLAELQYCTTEAISADCGTADAFLADCDKTEAFSADCDSAETFPADC
jgi:hypothetical protein